MGKMIQLPKILNKKPLEATNKIPRMAYNFEQLSETVTELNIYDDIANKREKDWWTGEEVGQEVTPQSFKDELNSIATNEIVVRINSNGGEVTAANVIAVAIQEARKGGKKISCKIDGMCASAAVQIALSCSPVIIHQSAYMMVHNPMAVLFGYYNSSELSETISFLDSIKQGIMNTYTSKTGLSEEEISKLMDDTTYMDGKKAVEMKFADALMFDEEEEEEEEEVINRVYQTAMNSIYDIPVDIQQRLKEKGAKSMNRADLEAKYPEIVNEIRQDAINSIKPVDNTEAINQAVNAERDRMKAIDEMAGKVDAEVLNKAKYETFETAEKVALNAIREGKFVNTVVLNALEDETKENNSIGSVPNGGVQNTAVNTKEAEAKTAENIAKEYLKKIGRGE